MAGQGGLGWFHRYPARFHASTVIQILCTVRKRLGLKRPWILDPFAGTGTTVAAAARMGMDAAGVELSTLGTLIAQVRLDPPKDLAEALSIVESMIHVAGRSWAADVSKELVGWIGDSNAKKLSHFLDAIDEVDSPPLKRFLQIAVSSSLRPSSRWLPGSIKPQVDPNRRPPDIATNLRRAAKRLAVDCWTERERRQCGMRAVIKGDAVRLPFADDSMDAIVTSPPYTSAYDYFDVQRLTYLAFGWSCEKSLQVGRDTAISVDGDGFRPMPSIRVWYEDVYGGERTVQGRALRSYVQAMEAHLCEAFRVVRPGGTVAYAVGDSVRQKKVFPLVNTMKELLRHVGFLDVRAASRGGGSYRRILPLGRNPRTGRFSTPKRSRSVAEFVVYATVPLR